MHFNHYLHCFIPGTRMQVEKIARNDKMRNKIMQNVRKEVIADYQHQLNERGVIVVRDSDKRIGLEKLQKAKPLTREEEWQFTHAWLATEYCVGLYGSSRLGPNTSDYKWARDLGYTLTREFGVSWSTGGGPNLMAAPLEGALVAINENPNAKKDLARASKRIGFVLSGFLDNQTPNEFLQIENDAGTFQERFGGFIDTNHAAIFAFGGYGSAWELFGFLQARQSHIQGLESAFPADFPIIAHPRWERLLNIAFEIMHDEPVLGKSPTVISEDDKKTVIITDDIAQIRDLIGKHKSRWDYNIYSRVVRNRRKK